MSEDWQGGRTVCRHSVGETRIREHGNRGRERGNFRFRGIRIPARVPTVLRNARWDCVDCGHGPARGHGSTVTEPDSSSPEQNHDVLHDVASVADGFAVHHPVALPYVLWDAVEQSRFLQGLLHSAPEHLRQRTDMDEEVPGRCNPPVALFRQPAAGDDEMRMRMVLQLASPGVQDAEEACDIAADESPVRFESPQRRRGAVHQRAVDDLRVGTGRDAQLRRQRERGQEVGAWKQVQNSLPQGKFNGTI